MKDLDEKRLAAAMREASNEVYGREYPYGYVRHEELVRAVLRIILGNDVLATPERLGEALVQTMLKCSLYGDTKQCIDTLLAELDTPRPESLSKNTQGVEQSAEAEPTPDDLAGEAIREAQSPPPRDPDWWRPEGWQPLRRDRPEPTPEPAEFTECGWCEGTGKTPNTQCGTFRDKPAPAPAEEPTGQTCADVGCDCETNLDNGANVRLLLELRDRIAAVEQDLAALREEVEVTTSNTLNNGGQLQDHGERLADLELECSMRHQHQVGSCVICARVAEGGES